MRYKTLEEFAKVLDEAEVDPKTLFGTGSEIDSAEDRFHMFTHPDRNPDQRDLATKLFAKVTNLAEQARGPAMVVKSPTTQYTLAHRIAIGDVSDVYTAAGQDVSKPKAVVTKNRVMFRPGGVHASVDYTVKVNRINGADKLLEREEKVLNKLQEAAEEKDVEQMLKYYPSLVESFPATQGFKRRVNVFVHEPGVYTLEDVATQHDHSLRGEHSVWMFKRVLTALAFAHQQGIIHGAITPEHILIHPANHQIQIVGWGQSVEAGKPIEHYSKNWENVYPDEALDKEPAQSGADIHMAALSIFNEMDFALGESSLKQFFIGCMCPGQWGRKVDGFELYDELEHLAKRVYGPQKFVELSMP